MKTYKRGRPHKRFQVIATDKGYDCQRQRQALRWRGITHNTKSIKFKTKLIQNLFQSKQKYLATFETSQTKLSVIAVTINMVGISGQKLAWLSRHYSAISKQLFLLWLTGWKVSLMVDIVIIWDNKLNNNSIKKECDFELGR